jgi:hypothetical protein
VALVVVYVYGWNTSWSHSVTPTGFTLCMMAYGWNTGSHSLYDCKVSCCSTLGLMPGVYG